eukprot:TRINITY_DN29868_c0_g1_i1.p2 TRINITY_DN29868_c0_g1~~TRINITY_DN29868_c0_g1_i1.p2  ORF type:complete len:268 (+),score=28.15 TRINITY_DN29868_c0_g1_i1:1-804(+)
MGHLMLSTMEKIKSLLPEAYLYKEFFSPQGEPRSGIIKTLMREPDRFYSLVNSRPRHQGSQFTKSSLEVEETRKIQDIIEDNRQLRTENENLKTRLDSAELALAEQAQQFETYRQQDQESLRKVYSEHENQLREIALEKQHLQQLLQEMQGRLAEYEQKLREADQDKQKLSDLNQQVREISAECDRLQRSLQQSQEKVIECEGKLVQARQEIKQLSESKCQLSKLEQETQQLSNSLLEAQTRVQEQDKLLTTNEQQQQVLREQLQSA